MKNALLALFLSITIFSCLDPTGENYINIPKPDANAITLELTDVTSDTIFIYDLTSFEIKYNGYTLNTEQLEIDLNGITVLEETKSNGFQIWPMNYSSGFYKMRLKVVASTSNGSLADRLDLEQINLSREFNVVIDKDVPPPIQITRLDSSSGKLTIHWSKYARRNFSSYTLTKMCTHDNYSFTTCDNVVITDPNITSWTDDQYVGGTVRYRIDLATPLQTSYGIEEEYRWDPKIVAEENNGHMTIRWRKPLYYQNCKKMVIQFLPNYLLPLETSDTSFITPDPLFFGTIYSFHLKYVSKHENEQLFSGNYSRRVYLGKIYDGLIGKPILYNTKSNLYYGTSPYYGFVVMDNEMNYITNTNTTKFVQISDNGEHFVTLDNDKFYQTHPSSLDTTFLLNTGDLSIQTNFYVGNNGLIFYYYFSGYKVVDLYTGEVKLSGGQPFSYLPILSPTGEHFVDREHRVYHYNGSTFSHTGNLPVTSNTMGIFTANGSIVTINDNGVLTEFNSNTLAVIFSTTLPSVGDITEMQLDPVTGNILFKRQAYDYYLFNTTAKTITKVTESQHDGVTALNGKVFLLNNLGVISCETSYLEDL